MASKISGLAPLKLRAEPRAGHLPAIRRALDEVDSNLLDAIGACVEGKRPWPLFIHGPAGTGKTCAALALLDHVHGPAWYWTASGWADLIIEAGKGTVSERCEAGTFDVSPGTLRQRVDRAALVVLDELATRGSVADWHYQQVKDVIDRRTNKPLVVISNHGLQGIQASYDDRIADRLAGGTVVAMKGPSRRLQYKRQGPGSAP